MGYVLAVRASHTLTVRPGRAMTAARAARLIPRGAWHRVRTGHGSKGLRHYDWAMLEVTSDDAPGDGRDDGRSVLLARRHRSTGTCSYYRCWTPGPVPLARLIAVAQARWRIEENHQLSKQVAGLDSGQVIRWRSWHRWSARCLPAFTYLAVTVALDRGTHAGLETGLIPVTIPEMLRMLRGTSSRRLAGTKPTASTGRNGVKGHRDFPVGGQLISLRADRLSPCRRSAGLSRVRSAASPPSPRWLRRAAGFCLR